MGIIYAKLREEELEYNQALARGAVYLGKCRPEYITNDRLTGLAPPDSGGGEGLEGEFELPEDATRDDEEDEEEKQADGEEENVEDDPRRRARLKLIADHKLLFEGAAKGYRYQVQSACRLTHVNIDARDKYGRSALFLAAERGHPAVISVLVGTRARLENPNLDGWTPLHAATFHGSVKCMERLITAQANFNSRDNYGCTPLALAASSPKLYILDLLSKKDRKKLQRIRRDAFQKQVSLEAGKKGDTNASLRNVPPDQLWTCFPNRVEIIVMEALFKAGRVQVDSIDKKKRTPLMYAARYGRVYAVSRLLAAKANQQLMDRDGRTPLMMAASNENVETAELLLRAGSNVNREDQFFKTPLHGALESGNELMADLLMKAQASVNAYDCEGRTPILLAMDQGNRRLFSAIVQRRSNLDVLDKRGWNVVIYAIETGMLPEITPLLQKLADKAKPILRTRDPQGRNAMHHATQLSNISQANKCTQVIAGIDPDAAIYGDCNGDTSIHMAAELGRLEVLKALLQGKESADYLNSRGETPLHFAAHGGHLACVVSLVRDRGKGQGPLCDAGAIDNEGKTILHHACVSGHLDLVNLIMGNREGKGKELLLPAIDVNVQDKEGATALMVAAREGHWQLLPSLFLAGANLVAKDKDGFTALHYAAVDDEPVSISCLIDLAMDPNVVDGIGWSSLMHAVSRGCDEAVRVLVDSTKVDIGAKNWDGDTALQLCARRTDPPELSQITRDILTDGILDNDMPTSKHIDAKGHFVVSILDAVDLYMEGKVGELNTYVCVQLRTHKGATPLVAFTTCVLQSPCPEWHEVFRFDVDSLDSTAVLVAWIIAAPGDDAEEVREGAELGLSEEELRAAKYAAAAAGQEVSKGKPEFTTALSTAFQRLTRRADRDEDREIVRLRKLALAQEKNIEPTLDLVLPKNQDGSPLIERRWNEVANLRATLEKSGCEVHEPLVPRTHLPLGCVVTRFRQLRTAVWETEPVQVARTLRLNCRGNLRLEVDFRPRYFEARENPRAKMLPPEEEDLVYTVHPMDVTHATADSLLGFVPPGSKPAKDPDRRRVRKSGAGGDNPLPRRSSLAGPKGFLKKVSGKR